MNQCFVLENTGYEQLKIDLESKNVVVKIKI
jgi:hypothetical protein